MALGFCATSHLDAVLTKLENVTKNDMTKKSGGLLSFMKASILFYFIGCSIICFCGHFVYVFVIYICPALMLSHVIQCMILRLLIA